MKKLLVLIISKLVKSKLSKLLYNLVSYFFIQFKIYAFCLEKLKISCIIQ